MAPTYIMAGSFMDGRQLATDGRHLLVTGTLAADALGEVAQALRDKLGVNVVVEVLNIQVAALLTTEWVARKLSLPADVRIDSVVLPGYCRGDLELVRQKVGVPVERGPRDLFELPAYFGGRREDASVDGAYSIEILAEINDAARLPVARIIDLAEAYRADGADVIDIGCDPQSDRPAWLGVADVVGELRQREFRVSVDSFHPREIELACKAGAELVLSVNSFNRDAAGAWGAEVVAIPDDVPTLGGLDDTIAHLERQGVAFRIDPIVEPIGMGFAQSLGRYLEVRRRYPQAAMMMGVGNLTEMTEVDSAGVNAVLIGFCQELNITSVLTTQVINWARSSVREIDVARRMMHRAVGRKTAPKHLDSRLVMLRDARLRQLNEAALATLAGKLSDRNIRLFAEAGRLHAMNKGQHLTGDDPFAMFEQLGIDDASHAFYLGYEFCKAVTALTLGKQYVQDEALHWGMLTREEQSHGGAKKRQRTDAAGSPDAEKAGE